jgi:hypothetical protein
LNYFFILSRENNTWVGVGYAVVPSTTTSLYTLYRYYATVNISVPPPVLYNTFVTLLNNGQWTNTAFMSPLLNGVVNLAVHPYDTHGIWMTNGYNAAMTMPTNTYFTPQVNGDVGFYFYGNTVPAAIELQMGVLEDHTLARAVSLPNNIPAAPPNDRRSQYLLSQAGSVHVFRQQVDIENVDRSVYPQ